MSNVECYFCVTCGAQFAPSSEPPDGCPICADERQYVGHDGQRWTTLTELLETRETRIEEIEPGLLGIGIEPPAPLLVVRIALRLVDPLL